MVTNINFAAPEGGKKISFSGKTSLILSGLLLVAVVGVYVTLSFLSVYYSKQEREVESQIQSESAKISGVAFAELADFQERLNLLDKILGDHLYFDGYLRNFSKYILPEVRLTDFSWKSSGNEIILSGVAVNFDVLSRQLILLKNSPIVQSVEFKSATGSSGVEGQSGVIFKLSTKLKKETLSELNN